MKAEHNIYNKTTQKITKNNVREQQSQAFRESEQIVNRQM